MTTEQNADSLIIDLKAAREKSGLTLKELFERTRISVVNLEAIENGDYHLLPVPIYTRNFIKTYADALGVDGKSVLRRYEEYLQALQVREREEIIEQPHDAPLIVILARYKAYLWVVCIVIVVAAISFFVSIYNKPSLEAPLKSETAPKAVITESPAQDKTLPDNLPIDVNLPRPENLITASQTSDGQTQPAPKGTEVQKSDAPAPAAAPKNSKAKTAALSEDEESSVLVVHATEKTWLRIQADNQESFQVLLNPGETISRKAARFNMDIGNAAGVRIQIDGKTIENLGKTGQVIHLRLP
jgi:cytoskeletal protein RodZ